MIKIYNANELSEETIYRIIHDDKILCFPINRENLDYLLEEHKNESFVLIGRRLYEYNLQ